MSAVSAARELRQPLLLPAEADPEALEIDGGGVCGGDDSTCSVFADGFESGDTSAWSGVVP